MPVASAALVLVVLSVPAPVFAGDRGGQPVGPFVSTELPADPPVAPLPPAASPASPDGSARLDASGWWLVSLATGLAGLGGLLLGLERHRCFDDLD